MNSKSQHQILEIKRLEDNIRSKYKALKNYTAESERALETHFQPVIRPLKSFTKKVSKVLDTKPEVKIENVEEEEEYFSPFSRSEEEDNVQEEDTKEKTQKKEDDGIQLHSLSPVENINSGEEDESALTSLKSPEPVHQPTSRRHRRRIVSSSQISAPEDDSNIEEHPSVRPVSRVSWRDLDEEIHPSPIHSSDGHSGNVSPPTETSQSRDEVSFSSRHYGTEVLSGNGSRSQTPLSETRSYRDRLRDRFQAVKERAGMSSRSRLREQRLHTPLSSRMDELLRKEEEDVEAALSKHEKLRVQWKTVADKAVYQDGKSDEGYDFFTRVWDDDEEVHRKHEEKNIESTKHTEEEIIHSAPSSPRSPEAEEEEVTGERVKLLAADLLGLRDEWELFEIVPPDCTDWENLHSKENRLLFFPSKSPVPLEDKLRPGCEVRYPEDEGLYVGSQPLVSYGNKNKMEQRLLAEGNMEWFGDDGEILTLPDPRTKTFCLGPLHDDDSKFPELVYYPAVVSNLKKQLITEPRRPNSNYVLEVEVSSVMFTHHPYFSREHVLAQKLTEKFNIYTRCISQDMEQRLLGKLTALRTARDNLRRVVEHCSETHRDQIERLQKYKEEIKETKKMRLYESYTRRQLLCDVLSLWRDLKRLRDLQGYSSTPVRLLIHKEPEVDIDQEHETWNEMIQLEIDELETELQDEYNGKFEQYQRQLAKWKKKQKSKKSRRHQADIESIEEEDDIYKIEEMEDTVTEMDEKPRPPEKVHSDDLRSELIEMLTESLRPPGEPKVQLELIHNAPFDQNPLLNKEKLRRMAVQRSEIFIKIFYNKKEVCKSQYRPLGQKFTVSIAQVFPICIVQWPEELKIEIHESGGTLSQHLISQIFLPIPSSHITRQNSEITKYEFSSDQVVTVNHSGVGSGVCFSVLPDGDNSESLCIFTSGYMSCKVGWATDASGKILAPSEKYLSPLDNKPSEMPDIDAMIDVEKLKAWTEKVHLDPNNPSNAPIFHYIQNADTSLYTEPDYFRLDPLQQEFDFCTMEDLDNNVRLKLLHLRDQGEPEFRGLCMIPLREKEIPNDIFKAYEKRISTPSFLPDTMLASDPLDSYRAWGQHFLQDVRQKILKQCRLAQKQRHLHDIITEDQVPDIGTLGLTFLKWLKPKRPLRPIRKERKKVTVQNLGGQEVKIIVNIVNAFNVPVRKDLDSVSTVVGPQGYKFAVVPVKPFVEVSFRDIVARTTASEGSNPTWNQELQISLQPPNKDFSPGTLQQLQDILYIHLFDEIVVDILEDDRSRGTVIHNRLERHWLGSLQIPFSTLYFNSRIEGTFQLYSPPVLLGYERESQHRHFGGVTGSFEQQGNGQRSATYLTVFITIQPALTPPEPFKERLESSEPEYIEQHLDNWEQEVLKIVPHRRVKTLVLDISGKSVCVTRFLRPLAPPVMAENQDTTDKMISRFVSMIPVVPGSVLFPGLFDIWLTSEQVLRLLTGDSEDLAVLLCCYFLYMGKKAWVLLGSGIPHGPTAYVLTYEEEQHNVYTYYLWDSVTGKKYEIWDSLCPLQSVYCLINDVNIWANIQSEELPRKTRYDVKRRSDWFPAFNRTPSMPPGSIQPAMLEYIPTSSNACQFLRDKIEKNMRDNLMKWRRTTRTLWNRYCTAILRKLLPTLEYSCWGLEDSAGQHHVQELQHVLGSHKMCGFPINMPYTNMEAITEAMKATGVHLNEDPNVEFALAVYIHPYPNNILSVWIYIASLVRRR